MIAILSILVSTNSFFSYSHASNLFSILSYAMRKRSSRIESSVTSSIGRPGGDLQKLKHFTVELRYLQIAPLLVDQSLCGRKPHVLASGVETRHFRAIYVEQELILIMSLHGI